MSRVNQYPALGGSRGVNYNQAEMSKDLQVYHLTSKHHPNGLYDGMYIFAKIDLTISCSP